jgi:hypothetical protein
MTARTLETCAGCGLIAWSSGDPRYATAERFGASNSCWATFASVLEREYSSSTLFTDIHTLTIDAYAAQHPIAIPDAALAAHLVRLHCVFELSWDTGRAAARARHFARRGRDFERLEPPAKPAELTVAHVFAATSELDHVRRAWEWAEAIWRSWAPHHAEVAAWAARGDGD